MNLHSVGIIGTGRYLPEKVLTNTDLEKLVETSDEWIVTRTGIKERRIADATQATSDLAYEAAVLALKDANIPAEELDLIIVCTVTSDTSFPSTSCILQDRLGAKKAAAFDLSAACSGFIYGLATAQNYIATGMYKYVLVIGAETLSKITDYTDRNTCVLFGDGAGAAVLGAVDSEEGFLSFELGADGSGKDTLKVAAGGSRMPATLESVKEKRHFIHMEGREVFKFAVRILTYACEKVLTKANLTAQDIDLFIPHQANIRIINFALEKLNIPREKCMVNLQDYANTSAASIPIALDEAARQGRLKKGDKVLMMGFGGGLTWAATTLVWSKGEEHA